MRRSAPMPIDDNAADNNLDKHDTLIFNRLSNSMYQSGG